MNMQPQQTSKKAPERDDAQEALSVLAKRGRGPRRPEEVADLDPSDCAAFAGWRAVSNYPALVTGLSRRFRGRYAVYRETLA